MKKNYPLIEMRTSHGSIKLELYEDKAPETVKNFLKYVENGFYQNTIFHRVIDGFMIQGGGFTSGMQQKETLPPVKNEAANRVSNERGTIAMARTSDVDSATAQFFINVEDNEMLDYRGPTPSEFGYCVFGRVVEGMDAIDKIRMVDTGYRRGHNDVPLEPVEILEVKKV